MQKILLVIKVDSYESEPCVVDDLLNFLIGLRKEPLAKEGKSR
jgi:hypothetical protein